MNVSNAHEKEIFNNALELESVEARQAYLREACVGDQQLRRRIETLLEAAAAPSGFLPDRSTVEVTPTPGESLEEAAGSVIDRYKLLEQIGEGGCGVVYMAEQQAPVRRRVALKVIKLGMDTKQVIARFEAERQALALMEHPNIARVFDAGATKTGRPYFVMELVRGIPLTRFCDENRLSTSERLELFIQICRAIQHAHQKGIIHRDIKPSNILVTINDNVPVPKIIDFGVAKATSQQRLTDKTLFTAFAQFIGTPAYMSPEQAALTSVDIDTRSDIYGLGVLLYELLAGQTPFDAKQLLAVGVDTLCRTIREQEPVRPSTRLRTMARDDLASAAQLRHSDPPRLIHLLRGDLDWIVMKCLEKDRNRRYETAHALALDVQRHLRHEPILARSPSLFYLLQKFARKHRVRLAAGLTGVVLLTSLFAALTMYRRAANLEWAKGEALPQVVQLVEKGENRAAFALAEKIKRYVPDDPTLRELWPRMCNEYSITTTPAGADVWCREYTATNEPWEYLGCSPLERVRLPECTYRWKFETAGFQTHECVANKSTLASAALQVRLLENRFAQDMVWVAGGEIEVPTDAYARSKKVDVPAFLIDKWEVTNEQFKRFVDADGYRMPDYWKGLRFAKDGREISWANAVVEFRDATGQPGPATWKGGTYPAGQDRHPVSGVSWFEAAAYAAFAGKTLPSVYHWDRAACSDEALAIVPLSNLGMRRQGTAVVGSHPGMGHTGLYDAAGNVKEWCFNATDDPEQARYILGGSWNEPSYVFAGKDSRSPWSRSPENGFRCARLPPGDSSTSAELFAPFRLPPWRDFRELSPFSDEEFESLKAQYRYDRTPLRARVEEVDDSSVFWRREKVTLDAAYGGQRVIAYLFLPKSAKPPYKTVVFFPGVDAVYSTSFTGLPYGHLLEYIISSGRALLFPIYYGTYERPATQGRLWTFPSVAETPLAYRDWTILMAKDLSRCLGYLETRTDVDSGRLAYCGVSHGAILGPIMLAVEDRIDTGIFVIGGFVPLELPRSFDIALYAQRVKVPVLMVNGKEDALLPVKESQIPMYESLRRCNSQTRHELYPGGHGVLEGVFYQQIREEVLSWLDEHLGLPQGATSSTRHSPSSSRHEYATGIGVDDRGRQPGGGQR